MCAILFYNNVMKYEGPLIYTAPLTTFTAALL